MFCSRSLNNSLNRFHERALWLIYDGHVYSVQDIHGMANEKTIDKKAGMSGKENLQVSAWFICTHNK